MENSSSYVQVLHKSSHEKVLCRLLCSGRQRNVVKSVVDGESCWFIHKNQLFFDVFVFVVVVVA